MEGGRPKATPTGAIQERRGQAPALRRCTPLTSLGFCLPIRSLLRAGEDTRPYGDYGQKTAGAQCAPLQESARETAPSSVWPTASHLPPGGRLRKNKKGQVFDLSLKTQRRNAVSQKVLLPTFLSRKVGGRNFSQKLPCFSPLLSNLIRKCKFSFRRLDTAPLGEYHRNDTNLRQNTGRRGIFTPGARGGLPCGEDF